MGYRTYISKVSKVRYEELQKLSKQELIEKYREYEDEDYIDSDNLKDGKYLYNFGKYTEFDDVLNKTPYFPNNKDINDMVDNDDTEFCIIDKESLQNIIKHYEDKVKKYITEIFESWKTDIEAGGDISDKNKEQISSFLWGLYSDWNIGVVDWGDSLTITKSWRYEYGVLELVRIYKTFDWDNYLLIYEGH